MANSLTIAILVAVTTATVPIAVAANDPNQTDAALISLARSAVRAEVTGAPTPPPVANPTPAAGVFVTIERQGRVIGCRGTLVPRRATLDDEITAAARAAAGHDPRYAPLTPKDLDSILLTVTIVDRLEAMNAGRIDDLTPADGLVLTVGSRTGVVLPWEGKDPRMRLRWAYKKAGVSEGSPCTLRRMIARRFRG